MNLRLYTVIARLYEFDFYELCIITITILDRDDTSISTFHLSIVFCESEKRDASFLREKLSTDHTDFIVFCMRSFCNLDQSVSSSFHSKSPLFSRLKTLMSEKTCEKVPHYCFAMICIFSVQVKMFFDSVAHDFEKLDFRFWILDSVQFLSRICNLKSIISFSRLQEVWDHDLWELLALLSLLSFRNLWSKKVLLLYIS